MDTELILSNRCTLEDIMDLWKLGYTFIIEDGRIAGIEHPVWTK